MKEGPEEHGPPPRPQPCQQGLLLPHPIVSCESKSGRPIDPLRFDQILGTGGKQPRLQALRCALKHSNACDQGLFSPAGQNARGLYAKLLQGG